MLSLFLSMFKSKTILGALLTAISGALAIKGITVDTAMLQQIVDALLIAGQWVLGPGLVIWGRITAKGPLVPAPAIAPPS